MNSMVVFIAFLVTFFNLGYSVDSNHSDIDDHWNYSGDYEYWNYSEDYDNETFYAYGDYGDGEYYGIPSGTGEYYGMSSGTDGCYNYRHGAKFFCNKIIFGRNRDGHPNLKNLQLLCGSIEYINQYCDESIPQTVSESCHAIHQSNFTPTEDVINYGREICHGISHSPEEDCYDYMFETDFICKMTFDKVDISPQSLKYLHWACDSIGLSKKYCGDLYIREDVNEACHAISKTIYTEPQEVLDYYWKICHPPQLLPIDDPGLLTIENGVPLIMEGGVLYDEYEEQYEIYYAGYCGDIKNGANFYCRMALGQINVSHPNPQYLHYACNSIEFVDQICNETIPQEVRKACQEILQASYNQPHEVLEYSRKICLGYEQPPSWMESYLKQCPEWYWNELAVSIKTKEARKEAFRVSRQSSRQPPCFNSDVNIGDLVDAILDSEDICRRIQKETYLKCKSIIDQASLVPSPLEEELMVCHNIEYDAYYCGKESPALRICYKTLHSGFNSLQTGLDTDIQICSEHQNFIEQQQMNDSVPILDPINICQKKNQGATNYCIKILENHINPLLKHDIRRSCEGIEFVHHYCNTSIPTDVHEECLNINLSSNKQTAELLEYSRSICVSFLRSVGYLVEIDDGVIQEIVAPFSNWEKNEF